MVQMKETCQKASFMPSLLIYIPHGSDERKALWEKIGILIEIYIPHGSDESSAGHREKTNRFELYIPHGSDESYKTSSTAHQVCMALYPTWFR